MSTAFLFVVDPLPTLKAYKDSSVAMMRECARRGHEVWTCEAGQLAWDLDRVVARVEPLELAPVPDGGTGAGPEPWYRAGAPTRRRLAEFAAVLMRKDPPFDTDYLQATLLLQAAVREGARVINDPRALRDHNEKLAITEFPHLIPPTRVTADMDALRDFHRELGEVVVKPLDGMGGRGVFRLRPDDPNVNVILELLTDQGRHPVMAQRYLPEIRQGDKRVLLIGGQAVPYALARVPKAGESRGNLAAGGTGRAQPLSERDREIAAAVGPVLAARGLLLVGLDVIGDYMTELNVTSPTCFVEITQQSGFHVARMFVDALEAALR